jgi:hypothetical protein
MLQVLKPNLIAFIRKRVIGEVPLAIFFAR